MGVVIPQKVKAAAAGARWVLPAARGVGRCRAPTYCAWFGWRAVVVVDIRGATIARLNCSASHAGALGAYRSYCAGRKPSWVASGKAKQRKGW